MKPHTIILDDDQMADAMTVGLWRQIHSQAGAGGDRDRFFEPLPTRWGRAIFGAAAELAVSLVLELPWTGRVEHSEADVGHCVQVRHSEHSDGCLIVNQNDPIRFNDVYVFVTTPKANANVFQIWGWIYADAARDPDYFRNGTTNPSAKFPSWWIPTADLVDIDELITPPL